MTIALSINAILAQVYAQAALRHEINTPDSSILTANSDAALRALAISAASAVAMAMMPAVTDTNIGSAQLHDPSADIITFELNPCPGISLPALRLLAERSIAAFLLSEVYAATDTQASQTYLEQHRQLTARISRTVRTASTAAIRPFP